MVRRNNEIHFAFEPRFRLLRACTLARPFQFVHVSLSEDLRGCVPPPPFLAAKMRHRDCRENLMHLTPQRPLQDAWPWTISGRRGALVANRWRTAIESRFSFFHSLFIRLFRPSLLPVSQLTRQLTAVKLPRVSGPKRYCHPVKETRISNGNISLFEKSFRFFFRVKMKHDLFRATFNVLGSKYSLMKRFIGTEYFYDRLN